MAKYIITSNLIDKQSFINGVKHSWPVCVASFFMYIALGVMGALHNMSLTQSTVMTMTMFTVPLQNFITCNQELSLAGIALSTFILSFRFTLMSVVLLTIWKKPKILSVPSLYFVCNGTYMVAIAEQENKSNWSFYLGVAFASYSVSVLSTTLGYFIYQIDSLVVRAFLGALAIIVMPIHFTCLTVKRSQNKMILIATLAGMLITPIAIRLMDKSYITFVFMGLAYLLVLFENKPCGNKS